MEEKQKGSEPKVESPTLAGSEPKKDATPSAEEQAKALLTELGRIGVEKPEQIVNMATASQQVGRVQNLLGSANQRIAQLEAELEARGRRPAARSTEEPNGESIDLASLIEERSGKAAERAVRKVVMEMNEVQRRFQRENMAIRGDEDYGMVKDVFEPFMQTPEAQARLEAGESMRDIYGEVKTRILKEMLKRSKDVLTNLTTTSTPGKQAIPHVEGNETRSVPGVEPDDEKSEKLKKIEEQRRSGRMRSDMALEDMIKTLLPADDPIWGARR